MAHDATVVLLGQVNSNVKEVSNHVGSIAAGLAVHLKSDDTITTAKADGAVLGISLGRDLSGTGHSSICRKGVGVPIQVTSGAPGAIGSQLAISDTTGKAIAYTGTGNTHYNGTVASGVLTGKDEDGNNVDVVLVDIPGGL